VHWSAAGADEGEISGVGLVVEAAEGAVFYAETVLPDVQDTGDWRSRGFRAWALAWVWDCLGWGVVAAEGHTCAAEVGGGGGWFVCWWALGIAVNVSRSQQMEEYINSRFRFLDDVVDEAAGILTAWILDG
jgi:hypothetical protein